MALGIPLPGSNLDAILNGIKTGSSFYANAMHPRLEREKQKQLEEHFQEELKLRKAAAGRASANSDLQRAILQQHLQSAMNKNDPEYEMNQIKRLSSLMGGAPSQPNMPQSLAGEGMGAFSPEGLEQAKTMPDNSGYENMGFDLESVKRNPILRGFFKHKFGFDPMEQQKETPEEKRQADFNLFQQKESLKAQKEEKLPSAIKTLHENIIHLSPKAEKAIQHIIDIPSPFEPYGLGAFYSGEKAAHNKAVTAAAENYTKAKGWPNTKGSIEKAESILQRGHLESDFDYRKRLREYQQELRDGMIESNKFLHPDKKIEEKPEDGVIEYIRVNGRLVPKG